MARPTKEQSQKKALRAQFLSDPWRGKKDSEILKSIHERFDVFDSLARGSLKGDVRSLIISGAPGISKTYTVEQLIKEKSERNPFGFSYKIIKGNVSPVNLFKILQDHSSPSSIVVLDDADSIFFDDDGVALLKAALDSTPERWISWHSESAALREGGEQTYNREFLYNGSMIFITNTDFQGLVDEGKSKLVPHLSALLSRSLYLDLRVHDRRAIALWVNHLVESKNILVNHFGITKSQQKEVLEWLVTNRNEVRTLSIRDAMKLGQMIKSDSTNWEKTARILLLKTEM